jgi:hypothetical protein
VGAPNVAPLYRVDRVVDGDTIALRNGQRVRLVQIDTPEVLFGAECYGRAASRATRACYRSGRECTCLRNRRPIGVDQYGRLLRYVVRVNGALNINIRLVAVGAAAPYFYNGRRGRCANRLELLAERARAKKLGLGEPVRIHPTIRTEASKRGVEPGSTRPVRPTRWVAMVRRRPRVALVVVAGGLEEEAAGVARR